MKNSSEYIFPVFISSTDYNLIDLRAELALSLNQLGYKAIVSSAEAFHDYSPKLDPWESCLPVLSSCFVVILIIDGRYGRKFKWPNFREEIGVREISPTHAEYLFAHKKQMRMIVFVRDKVMTFYQSYREAMDKAKGDKQKAKKALAMTLPENIVEFEALEFLHEVKTSKPIPWISEFDDVTSIKSIVQKKMINELVDYFKIKEKYTDVIVEKFNSILNSMSKQEQYTLLQKIGVTGKLLEAEEQWTKALQEIEKLKKEVAAEQGLTKRQKETKEKEIESLKKKVQDLERENLVSSVGYNPFYFNAEHKKFQLTGSYGALSRVFTPCAKCGKVNAVGGFLHASSGDYRTCWKCHRSFCSDCWPNPAAVLGYYSINNFEVCPICREETPEPKEEVSG